MRVSRLLMLCAILLVAAHGTMARAAPVAVLAAESSYGDIARFIGGTRVKVTSIIVNANVDPHDFMPNPRDAREALEAQVIIRNGLGFDPWLGKILATRPDPRRQVIVVGELARGLVPAERNPHIFYDPRAALIAAAALRRAFTRVDPAHGPGYERRYIEFEQALLPVWVRIQALAARYPGARVAATVPVYGYMLRLLGFEAPFRSFRLALMNHSSPSPKTVAAFVTALRRRRLRVLIYNPAALGPLGQRMVEIARGAGVPGVPVSPVPRPGQGYVAWQLATLERLAAALARGVASPR